MIGSLLSQKYDILQELGDGPLFHAYLAQERATNKNVVVRVTKPPFNDDSEFIKSLRECIARSQRIGHPHVSAAIAMEQHNGNWFLVHKYHLGQPLSQRLKRVNGLGVSTSVGVMIRILEALVDLHDAGLIHGDLRADNVVISSDGVPTLLVPCIAEAYSSSDRVRQALLPKNGPYLAPECHRGEGLSRSSDLFAVGVVLYEMLVGEPPFRASTGSEHANSGSVPSITRRVPTAPAVLDRIIEKALCKNPADRYPDARSLMEDLTILQDALKFGTATSWPLKPAKGRDRPRIGPRLNTVGAEEKDKRMAERWSRDQSDGAPRWLVFMSISLIVAALGVIAWWMVFRLNAPQTRTVPNIVGMSFSEASTLLKNINLTLRQSKQVPSDQYPEGIVLEIRPAASRAIKEGSFVDAVVSSGSSTVEVPDITGKTPDEAKGLLEKMGLSLSDNILFVFDSAVPSGHIVSQRPAKHLIVGKKSKVQIEVSKGAAVEVPDPPPSLVPYLYHLSWNMPDGTAPIKVRVEMRDASGQKSIYEQVHSPNDKVTIDIEGLGDSATFTIYYDDRVVKTFTQEAANEPEMNPESPTPPDEVSR